MRLLKRVYSGLPIPLKKIIKTIYISLRWKNITRNVYLTVLKIIKKDLDYLYNDDFASGPYRDKIWVEEFCDLVLRTFHPESVIDFGCGSGDILRPFEAREISVLGIDGSSFNKRNRKIKEDNFLQFDLRNDYIDGKQYDLCFCFEVAEHIEEKYSEVLIRSLTRASPTILFTASPSEAGVDHVNVHQPEWWIDTFDQNGFTYDARLTETLKKKMTAIKGIQKWYVENLLVFKKSV
ncbi:MAG: methyltransferase domain-containing protein [Candidatus Omnitrophota bacterium]